MKSVLGKVFSLIGNIGLFILFFINVLLFLLKGGQEEVNYTLNIIFMCLFVVIYGLATIGNKFQDNDESANLLRKYKLMKIGKVFFGSIIMMFISVVGLFILIFGVANKFGEFTEANNTLLMVMGGFLFIGGSMMLANYGYTDYHCKYCGENLKGSSFEYEEFEREYNVGNDNKVHAKSKVEFIFHCASCGEENVRYKKMPTDRKSIDKYARGIVGR